MTTFSYHDLLKSDGSLNRIAVREIAAARAAFERNLAICVDSGIRAPDRLLYAEVRPFYAREAAKLAAPASVAPFSVYFRHELRMTMDMARSKLSRPRRVVAPAIFSEAA